MTLHFLLFAASRREQSLNRALAGFCADRLLGEGHDVDHADYAEFCAPLFDERAGVGDMPPQAREFISRLEAADGLILCAPEYNWSMPGSLKSLLDWVSLKRPYPVVDKPVLLLSASPSRRGGMIGLTQLRQPFQAMGAIVHPQMVSIAQAGTAFANGRLDDAALVDEVSMLLSRFAGFTALLRGVAA